MPELNRSRSLDPPLGARGAPNGHPFVAPRARGGRGAYGRRMAEAWGGGSPSAAPGPGPTPVADLLQSLEFVLESAAVGYWDLDVTTDTMNRSLAHDQSFGYAELLSHWSYETFLAHVHPQDRDRVADSFAAALHGRGKYHVEFRVVWPDGSLHWLLSRGRSLHGPDGSAVRVAGIVCDITDAKMIELAAHETASRFASVVDSMADAVVCSTPEGVITGWNRAAEKLFGWRADEVIGLSVTLLLPPDPTDEARAQPEGMTGSQSAGEVEVVRRRRDGSLVEVSVVWSPWRDAQGQVVEMIALARDITERRRMERALQHQATHDALTGLPNRALLADRLDQALAAATRSGGPLAVLVLDLDDFKVVNDAAGHAVGDLLLVETAHRLGSALRPGDTVARFGGDEFVVICTDADADAAAAVAERLHEALGPAMEVEGQRHHVTASIGIALSPPLRGEDLMRSADVAMSDAKSTGRARSRLFESPMAERAQSQLELSLQLREAVTTGALELHYQPVVDLTTGEMTGVEALTRWNRPGRTPVPPSVFIAVAEQTGLITALDRWVIDQACRDGAAMVASGLLSDRAHVAVNVGVRDVCDALVVSMVVSSVAAAGPGFGYERLVVEVTETAMMNDSDAAQQALQELRDLGVGVALDDFGTGYSSLTHLQRLPISVLKIDASFVRQITEQAHHLAITRSLVDLATALGIRTVAEGVETREQLHLLQRLGCAAGQGWLWSRAVPLAELGEMLQALPQGRFDVS